MLSLIHSDVLNYIVHTYLYYSSDLKNLNILFEIKFPLKTHLSHITIDDDYNDDHIDEYDNEIGAIRTFLDDKIVYYSYKNKHYTAQSFYYGKYDKTILCWDHKVRLSYYETYNIMNNEHFLHGIKLIWYTNGNLSASEKYNYDDSDGPYLTWSRDGTLKHIHNYEYNYLHGISLRWHTNGIKRSKGSYDSGKKVGEHIFWDKNGNLKCIKNYGEMQDDDYYSEPEGYSDELNSE